MSISTTSSAASTSQIMSEIEQIIMKYDLLQHRFYQAWNAGMLQREDLKMYAEDYYHQVAAFPTYLSTLHARLPDGPFRRMVLHNLCEEEIEGRAHSEIWLDFAEGMGANRNAVKNTPASSSTQALIDTFRLIAQKGTPLAAVGAFYAYESQVARLSVTKAEGLQKLYGADDKTAAYFTHHATWDQAHSQVWAKHIERHIDQETEHTSELLSTVKEAAQAMWNSLDGIYARCNLTAC